MRSNFVTTKKARRTLRRKAFDMGMTVTGILVLFELVSLLADSAIDVAFAICGVTEQLAKSQVIIHNGLVFGLYAAAVVSCFGWLLYFLIMEATEPTPAELAAAERKRRMRAMKMPEDPGELVEQTADLLLLVGSYDPETDTCMRAAYGQGFVFKDENAYRNHPYAVCYVPELSDTRYRAVDIYEMTGESMASHPLADMLFAILDWQCPETELEALEL